MLTSKYHGRIGRSNPWFFDLNVLCIVILTKIFNTIYFIIR